MLPLLAAHLLAPVLAQFPQSAADLGSLRTLQSPVNENITISYKSPPAGTCTTVFPSQKQYTGYISLPPQTLAPIEQNYSINTFFWFVEARINPAKAPLTIYMNGGPGSSSLVGFFQESGPCEVVEVAKGQLGTQARDWGWDRSSNIIYIDQPDQVGFSYDSLTNGSLNLLNSQVQYPPAVVPSGQAPDTFLNGTFPSGNAANTANTTAIAARTVWHLLQGFLGAFPQYNPALTLNGTTANGVLGVNLFTESYGGKFGPAFASYWEDQNAARRNGSMASNGTFEIALTSLGIIQGCVDDLVQGQFYPDFAYNNTYGIQAIDLLDQQNAASEYLGSGGCQQSIESCRYAVSTYDQDDYGDNDAVNKICSAAQTLCNDELIGPYLNSGRNIYDIAQEDPSPFPSSTYLEYLNNINVQKAIGAPLNFTQNSGAVTSAFQATGDYDRGDQISDLSSLLAQGVRVAFIYGDRDFICNWMGGESVSFSVAAQSPAYSPFYSAGYAAIVVNSTYVGGAVRQYGNLSFSRIYDAGHLVPAYQPETAFTVFTRIIMGTDISTGEPANLTTFATQGDGNATHTNSAPSSAEPTCWVRDVTDTCTSEQQEMLRRGQGVIINGILYDKESDWTPPASSMSMDAGTPGSFPTPMKTAVPSKVVSQTATTSTSVPTGVYVATATPSMHQKGAAARFSSPLSVHAWSLVSIFFVVLSYIA